jgi:LEA14-like dessication related protein
MNGGILSVNRRVIVLIFILLFIVAFVSFYVFVGFEFEIGVTQSWGMVTRETTEIKTLIAIYNPTILSRWLKRIEFDLYINGLRISSGTFENGVEVKPLGKTEVSLTSFLNNSQIPELWVTYLKKDEFDVTLIGNVTFASVIREIVCPIGYKTVTHTPLMELLSIKQPTDIQAGPATMTLKVLTLTWGKATSAQSEINGETSIYNPNSYPITIKKINYTIEMNDVKMGEGVIYNQTVIEAKTDKNVSFTAIMNNAMLSDWWAAFIRNDQVARVYVNIRGVAEYSGTDYDFIIAEVGAEASIRILSGTMSYRFYIPIS